MKTPVTQFLAVSKWTRVSHSFFAFYGRHGNNQQFEEALRFPLAWFALLPTKTNSKRRRPPSVVVCSMLLLLSRNMDIIKLKQVHSYFLDFNEMSSWSCEFNFIHSPVSSSLFLSSPSPFLALFCCEHT